MSTVSLVGTASYLPETIVTNDFFQPDPSASNRIFKGAKTRHHVAPGEQASEMIQIAAERMAEKLNLDLTTDIDIILTNVTCADMPFTGAGASVAKRLGASPEWVLDVHNTGCVSFVYMMKLAQSMMATSGARTALLCNVQNTGGRIFSHPSNRLKAQSAVPGDGCGVGLLVASDEAPVKAVIADIHCDYADDMQILRDDGTEWYQPGEAPAYINFDERRIARIVARGNKLVPQVVRKACKMAEIDTTDLDLLVTNQPNPIFLRNWREALQLPEEKHVHTYEEHGNMFGAAIPISLERALEQGRVPTNGNVALGGFSHAGDYSAAAVLQWGRA